MRKNENTINRLQTEHHKSHTALDGLVPPVMGDKPLLLSERVIMLVIEAKSLRKALAPSKPRIRRGPLRRTVSMFWASSLQNIGKSARSSRIKFILTEPNRILPS